MRRVISIIFFILGGWLLTSEPLLAFMDMGDGPRAMMPLMLLFCIVVAAVPLGIAVAVSPGQRWRELGLTILIAAGFGVFAGVAFAAVFLDPGFKPMMPALPPMPKIGVAAVTGTINLVLLAGIGLLLYRPMGRKAAAAT